MHRQLQKPFNVHVASSAAQRYYTTWPKAGMSACGRAYVIEFGGILMFEYDTKGVLLALSIVTRETTR